VLQACIDEAKQEDREYYGGSTGADGDTTGSSAAGATAGLTIAIGKSDAAVESAAAESGGRTPRSAASHRRTK
jgi:hypothetical protein